jgi:hypothetical protein
VGNVRAMQALLREPGKAKREESLEGAVFD